MFTSRGRAPRRGPTERTMRGQEALKRRVVDAANAALTQTGHVAPVEIVMRLGWLPPTLEHEWRNGERELFAHMQISVEKLRACIASLDEWAKQRGLVSLEATYVARSRAHQPLRFSSALSDVEERAWRTHWTAADASPKQLEKLQQKLEKAPDLFCVDARDFGWTCGECKDTGPFYLRDGNKTLCLACADLDHLTFLPAGDATLSRRAKAKSKLSAVVMRFVRSRKRWERRGVLVEADALAAAEQQCIDDAPERAARKPMYAARRAREDALLVDEFQAAVLRLFPSCPKDEAREIAEHAAERHSGRVGRSAAGRALDDDAITLAVIASIRHRHTKYDDLLMRGVERFDARDRIRGDVDDVLRRWRAVRAFP